MKFNIFKALAISSLTLSVAVSVPAFADDKAEFEAMRAEYQKSIQAAAKSSDIRAGLIRACSIKYKKAVSKNMLTQAEATKLCTCNVDAEGQVTVAENWALQSAANAKNAQKFQQLQQSIVNKQGAAVKSCVGSALDQKLTKLAQQFSAKPR